MTFQSDAPIVQKVYDFYRELYLTVEKMPKKDKYTLGARLQNLTLGLLELIIEASQSSQEQKQSPLKNASIKLDILKINLRLAYEIKAIDNNKYLRLEERLQEIGKMLGGWLRSIKTSL